MAGMFTSLIEEAIVSDLESGRWPPGYRLSSRRLARELRAELGIRCSKEPVIMALRKIEAELGYVQVVDQVGTFVT